MIDPVSSCIQSERKLTYGVSVDFVIKLEEDTETGACKQRMGLSGKNVIRRKRIFCVCESL
jgi:hypothetical protein